jgi:phosphoribosylanthranilate isomerase
MSRVQLNGRPTAEQYEKLHKQMKQRGFTRVIESSEHKWYWLSHGEYNRETNASHDQVLADAKAAAATVSTDYEVLVSETASSKWFNLKAATKADAAAA